MKLSWVRPRIVATFQNYYSSKVNFPFQKTAFRTLVFRLAWFPGYILWPLILASKYQLLDIHSQKKKNSCADVDYQHKLNNLVVGGLIRGGLLCSIRSDIPSYSVKSDISHIVIWRGEFCNSAPGIIGILTES